MSEREPVMGECWTDHRYVPHGTQAQVIAWLLAGPNPGRLVRVTGTEPRHGVAEGHVGYARAVNQSGALGHQHAMDVAQFMRSFRRIPDEPPHPDDVPPERPL